MRLLVCFVHFWLCPSFSVQMLGSTCVLPFLALCMLPQETSSAVLPDGFRDKRVIHFYMHIPASMHSYTVYVSSYNVIAVHRKWTGRTKSSSCIAQTRDTCLWVTMGRRTGMWTSGPLLQRQSSPQQSTFLPKGRANTRTTVKPMKRGEEKMGKTRLSLNGFQLVCHT